MAGNIAHNLNTPLAEVTPIPTKWIGPVPFTHKDQNCEISVPLATYETTLWPSTNRGAKATRLSGGIQTTIQREGMTRSVIFTGPTAAACIEIADALNHDQILKAIQKSSRHAVLKDIHTEVHGRNLYLRISIDSGNASGHNMVTKAADYVMEEILKTYPQLEYGSISGNMCVDKKVSAINGILGRGKHVIAECTLSREVCRDVLKTTPEKLHDLNIQKNYVRQTVE